MAGKFRIVGHTAEMALEIEAEEWASFYEAAGKGLLALYGLGGRIDESEGREVKVEAESPEELLVAWLNELIFLIGTKRWLPGTFEATADGKRLFAKLLGRPLRQGELQREIKAATFGGLAVSIKGGRYSATVILDV